MRKRGRKPSIARLKQYREIRQAKYEEKMKKKYKKDKVKKK